MALWGSLLLVAFLVMINMFATETAMQTPIMMEFNHINEGIYMALRMTKHTSYEEISVRVFNQQLAAIDRTIVAQDYDSVNRDHRMVLTIIMLNYREAGLPELAKQMEKVLEEFDKLDYESWAEPEKNQAALEVAYRAYSTAKQEALGMSNNLKALCFNNIRKNARYGVAGYDLVHEIGNVLENTTEHLPVLKSMIMLDLAPGVVQLKMNQGLKWLFPFLPAHLCTGISGSILVYVLGFPGLILNNLFQFSFAHYAAQQEAIVYSPDVHEFVAIDTPTTPMQYALHLLTGGGLTFLPLLALISYQLFTNRGTGVGLRLLKKPVDALERALEKRHADSWLYKLILCINVPLRNLPENFLMAIIPFALSNLAGLGYWNHVKGAKYVLANFIGPLAHATLNPQFLMATGVLTGSCRLIKWISGKSPILAEFVLPAITLLGSTGILPELGKTGYMDDRENYVSALTTLFFQYAIPMGKLLFGF